MVRSPSNLSTLAIPRILRNAPGLMSFNISFKSSFFAKILITMESVKSVTAKITMVLSLRISLVSRDKTFPRMVTSPIGPSIFTISKISSSSKSSSSPNNSFLYKFSFLLSFSSSSSISSNSSSSSSPSFPFFLFCLYLSQF